MALDLGATALLARAMGASNDLFPRWLGAREWLLHGVSPYASSVSDAIRSAMGGAPGGDPDGAPFAFGFVYPGYVALLVAPLALLPFSVALTIWLLGIQAAVVAGAWLSRAAVLAERRSARLPPLPFLAAAVLFPPSVYNLLFGQFAALTFVALAGAWLLLIWRRDAWAGVTLAAALVKPSLALLPALSLVGWALANRRWRFALASLAVTSAVVGGSLALVTGWPAAFWRSTVDYAHAASATNAASLVADVLTRSPLHGAPRGATAVAIVVGCALVARGWAARRCEAGTSLAAGALLGALLVPPLYEWNSVLLLFPLAQALAALPRARTMLGVALLVAASMASFALLLRWPSESRALWPAATILLWARPWRAQARSRAGAIGPAKPSQ